MSTLNHELAEWRNDPFTNHSVPDWTARRRVIHKPAARQPFSRSARSARKRADLQRLPGYRGTGRICDLPSAAAGAMAVIRGSGSLERLWRLVYLSHSEFTQGPSRLLPVALGGIPFRGGPGLEC